MTNLSFQSQNCNITLAEGLRRISSLLENKWKKTAY
jgi:hypothetical protein